jgi:hypothetical protein
LVRVNIRVWAGLAVVSVLALACLFCVRACSPRHEELSGIDLPHVPATLTEVIYEQGFEPVQERSERLPPEALQGYALIEPTKQLFSCMPQALPKADHYVGQRLTFAHARHENTLQRLYVADGWTWKIAEAPPGVDPLAEIRVPATVKVTATRDGCTVECEGKKVDLKAGAEAVVWEGKREMPFAEFQAEVAKKRPVKPEDVPILRILANASAQNVVTIHARVRARFHGGVRMGSHNLRKLRDDGESAYREGKIGDARSRLRTYLNFAPNDRYALELLQKCDVAKAVYTVRGSVTLSKPSPRPVFVSARQAGDPPDQARASTPTAKQRYQLTLPSGDYEIVVHAPGYKPKSIPLSLVENKELNIELTDADLAR